ncbi:carbamoyl-phosphate synthase small subunit [Pseudonocardia ammonioxydans]|uniref:Carbamoyl phosphate synthase small chain n=1 Tax=Pseudonocardia ammonioxydans TaxID=260086 RepID=A0A1I5A8Z6_PSUAM|nr:carbamoyl-phosphate synthase small subunit [Pseudonocardia ammonioxydans]
MGAAGNGPSPRGGENTTALLVLEDGRIFRGEAYGATGATFGEAVFTTGMTGYQETLTDPSYHRQIVLQTAPQIGNTGWNTEDDESSSIQVAGYVVRDPARRPSNWRSTGSLEDALRGQRVVGVAGIDTRAAVRHLRERGAMRAGIFSGDALAPDDELVEQVRRSPQMEGADLYGAVTTGESYVVPAAGERRFVVAALDVGIKFNTPRMMAARGIEVHVLPASSTIETIESLRPDGFFLANGPGDPATADGPVALTRQVLERRIPLFGICFGNQLLGRALGRSTYKLRYGHRGINIPVVEHATGRVAITSQNHGFAVAGEAGEEFDTPYGRAQITHTCPNDGCVEGMAGIDFPAFSVQYHPEAAAGPHDAADLFDRFVQLMTDNPVGYAGVAGQRPAGVEPAPYPDPEELPDGDPAAPSATPAAPSAAAAPSAPAAPATQAAPSAPEPDAPPATGSSATAAPAGTAPGGAPSGAASVGSASSAAAAGSAPSAAGAGSSASGAAPAMTAQPSPSAPPSATAAPSVDLYPAAPPASSGAAPIAPHSPEEPRPAGDAGAGTRPGPAAGPDAADHTTRLPVSPAAASAEPGGPAGEPETSRMPAVGRPGTPDPLTAPFSDIEDALRRESGLPGHPAAAGDPGAAADPRAHQGAADPVTGRSGPVDDRPWPPPATDPTDEQARPGQEDH